LADDVYFDLILAPLATTSAAGYGATSAVRSSYLPLVYEAADKFTYSSRLILPPPLLLTLQPLTIDTALPDTVEWDRMVDWDHTVEATEDMDRWEVMVRWEWEDTGWEDTVE